MWRQDFMDRGRRRLAVRMACLAALGVMMALQARPVIGSGAAVPASSPTDQTRGGAVADILPWIRLHAVGLHAGTPIALVEIDGVARLVKAGDRLAQRGARRPIRVVSIDPVRHAVEFERGGQTRWIDRGAIQ